MITVALSLAVLAGSGGSTPAAAADLTTKTYDLAAALPATHSSDYAEPLAPFLWPARWEIESSLESQPIADAAAEVVLGLFESEFSYDGRSVDLSDGRLRVVAPPAVHKEIERVIGFLESSFRRSVELRIDFVARGVDAPALAPFVSPKEADELIAAAGGVARTHVLRVQPGRVAVLDTMREVPVIGDYDVEIAERAAQFDPVIDRFGVGTRIAARAAIVPGGFQLALVVRDGTQLGELRETRMTLGTMMVVDSGRHGAAETVTLQSLAVLQRSLALNLTLPEGRVAVIDTKLAVQSGAARVALLVRASAERRDPSASLVIGADRARLEILDGSYVCPPHVELGGPLVESTSAPRALSQYFDIASPSFSGEPAVLARPASGATGWLEEQAASSGTYQAVSIAPWVIVYTQRQGDQLAPPLYAPDGSALAQARARENATLGLTLRRAGASGAVLAQTQLTLSFGERSAAVLGGETLSIADADVEVANGAATIDPIMSDAFDGLIVSALPVRASDGATVVELRARAHVLAREPQVVAIGAPLSIQGERREYDDLIADERLVFAAQGGARRVTLGGGALVLEVELR